MAENLDKGHFGEQGMGFFLGREGYFFIEGPSGAGGHAANASGFDGVAYSLQRDDLIIPDNKAFASTGNVGKAPAIDPTVRLTQYLDPLIQRVQNMADLPAQQRILTLLQQTRNSVTSSGVTPPPNVRIAITNFGGNSTGVTRALSARGIRFIDMSQAPRVPAQPSRIYFSKDAILSMTRPASVDEVANTQVRMGRVGAAAVAAATVAQWANDVGLNFQIKRELGKLTKPIAEALGQGGGALVVVNIIVTSPPGVLGATRARSVSSSFVRAQPNGNREQALRNWANASKLSISAPHIENEEQLFWIPPPQTK